MDLNIAPNSLNLNRNLIHLSYNGSKKPLYVLNPVYYRLDFRYKDAEKEEDSEAASLLLKKDLELTAKRLNMSMVILGDENFRQEDIEKIEETFWLNIYRFEDRLKKPSSNHYTSFYEDQIEALKAKYKSNYIVEFQIASVTQPRNLEELKAIWTISLFIWPLAPIALYQTITPQNNFVVFYEITDLDGQYPVIKGQYVNSGKYNRGAVEHYLYDLFAQINMKAVKK